MIHCSQTHCDGRIHCPAWRKATNMAARQVHCCTCLISVFITLWICAAFGTPGPKYTPQIEKVVYKAPEWSMPGRGDEPSISSRKKKFIACGPADYDVRGNLSWKRRKVLLPQRHNRDFYSYYPGAPYNIHVHVYLRYVYR